MDVTQCLTCPKGREFVNRTSECEVCAAGRFQNSSTKPSAMCSFCPAGRYLTDDGKTHAHEHLNASQCLPCDPGTYATSTGSASCAVCPGGQYTDAKTEANPDCKRCAPGKLNNDKAETASKHDNENDCDVCPPGQISRLGDTYCFNCPAGWTNNSANASEPCAMCAPGRRSSANGRVCEACPTGQSNPTAGLSYCRPCLPGEFGNETGLTKC